MVMNKSEYKAQMSRISEMSEGPSGSIPSKESFEKSPKTIKSKEK